MYAFFEKSEEIVKLNRKLVRRRKRREWKLEMKRGNGKERKETPALANTVVVYDNFNLWERLRSDRQGDGAIVIAAGVEL